MSHYDSSRAGSAGPSFLHRLASAAPTEYGVNDSVDMRTESEAGDMDVDMDRRPGQAGQAGQGLKVFEAADLDAGPEEAELDDLRRLARVWVRERGVLAVLGWEGDLLDAVLDKLEQQQKMVAILRGDPNTSEEEHLRLVLVQTEMERAKFLVRSYVRTRLHKVEKFTQHILASSELSALLSPAELQHARGYASLVATHFAHSVLDSLPERLRGMDDSYNNVSMVTQPNHDTPVVIYCRRDCGEIDFRSDEDKLNNTDDGLAFLEEGTTHMLPYKYIERFVSAGMVEVL